MELYELAVKMKTDGEAELLKSIINIDKQLSSVTQQVNKFGAAAAESAKETKGLDTALLALGTLVTNIGLAKIFGEAAAQADEATNALLRLKGAANVTGTPYEDLVNTAEEANRQFYLGNELAAAYADKITVLAKNAGMAARSQELLAYFLDLTKTRGMSAEDAMSSLNAVIFDQQRGFRALFSTNIADEYDKFARATGRTAAELTEFEKTQIRVNALIRDGSNAAGQYSEWLESVQGKEHKAAQEAQNMQERLGKLLTPIRELSAEIRTKLLKNLGDVALAFGAGTGGVLGISANVATALSAINNFRTLVKGLDPVLVSNAKSLGIWGIALSAVTGTMIYAYAKIKGITDGMSDLQKMEMQLIDAEASLKKANALLSSGGQQGIFQLGPNWKEIAQNMKSSAEIEINTLRGLIKMRTEEAAADAKAASVKAKADDDAAKREEKNARDLLLDEARKRALGKEMEQATSLIALKESGGYTSAQLEKLKDLQISFAMAVSRANVPLDEQVQKMDALRHMAQVLRQNTLGDNFLPESKVATKADYNKVKGLLPFAAPGVREIIADGVKEFSAMVNKELSNTKIDIPIPQDMLNLQAWKEQLASAIASSVVEGFVNGIATGIQKGAGQGFKAFAATMLRGLGQAMISFGTAALLANKLMVKILASLASLNPATGIVASIAMIAAGAALVGAAGAFGGGGGGGGGGSGGGGYSSYGSTGDGGGVTRLVYGQTSSTTAAGLTPQPTNNVWVIGPDDPAAQRQLQKMFNNWERR